MIKNIISFFFVITCIVDSAFAFNGHQVTSGPLKIIIDPVRTIQQYDQESPVNVQLNNYSGSNLEVTLRLDQMVDEMTVVGNTQKTIIVPANGRAESNFAIAFGHGAFSALYPVHIYAESSFNGSGLLAHAVRIVQTDFSLAQTLSDVLAPAPINVSVSSPASLIAANSGQVIWKYLDSPEYKMPVGFSGVDQDSGTYVNIENVFRGEIKTALAIHPPWRPHAGTALIEYHVILPNVLPLTLTFDNAIRDHHQSEPPSDGVTFRVWVDGDKLYERHTDSKIWLPGTVNLSPYAGQEITLRLESHPGPQNDTTCDTSYWAQPMIIAGTPPVFNTSELWQQQRQLADDIISGKTNAGPDTISIPLDDNYIAVIVLGPNGMFDSSIAIGTKDKHVIFQGFELAVLNQQVGRSLSGIKLLKFKISHLTDRSVQFEHLLSVNGKPTSLTAKITPAQTGLKFNFHSPERITDISLGSADQTADRIYYGHGYCIENPKPFQAGFGGHNLSTSHVGFDFASGISLVTASDNPPDRLVVNPDTKTYSLHTHMNATITIVPSTKNAFDAALRYRPLYDKQPAPAFAQKAGRFVFDIWGGRYTDAVKSMQQMIDYGLTDSMLTMHVWQRWGYDYRLPDIYPPNPDQGSIAELQTLSALCRNHDIPWGLHDNYIDFYPDANEYSYDHIAFTESGQPIKAWINEGRDAQSYRWRPDRIMPFVKRNLKLIKPELQPTHYFIDVFTSIDCFDFYDRHGSFHSFLETRQCWGEAFSWIRDYLGGSAVMTSEAGHDQLTGYIEGADCQFLSLSDKANNFMIYLQCGNWEKVPWYDTVLHDKFSLHGVGYSSRYQGGRDRQNHGIESDDYISAELLTGHALMTDIEAFGPGAVRKYYLAQDFIRSIADDTIKSVEFIDNDIHRQKITWNSDATVYVNRSSEPWHVAGKSLPPYGYCAQNGPVKSSIETINNITVERSAAAEHFYVNARGYRDNNQLEISPVADHIDQLDSSRFKLFIDWNIARPGPKDAVIFLHFVNDDKNEKETTVFQGDFSPQIPVDKWQNQITTGDNRIIYVPDHVQPDEYKVYVGMWSPKDGKRFRLRGENTGSNRYLLAKLIIEKDDRGINKLKLIPHQPEINQPWGNVARTPINFGTAVTSGAFRCELGNNKLRIIPLPGLDPFEIKLNLKTILNKPAIPTSLYAITPDDIKLNTINYSSNQNRLTFQTQPGTFAYELVFE